MKKLIGTWRINCYPVKTVAELTHDQALVLLSGQKGNELHDSWIGYEPEDLRITIDYPMDKSVTFKVKPRLDCLKEKYVSLGLFLLDVAKKYTEIYKKPKKYGIWGHHIDDLVFESVTVTADGRVTLGIGS